MLDHTKTRWIDPVAPRRPNFVQRTIIAPLLRRRRRRTAIADLEGLCDHLLADIGLMRSDIPKAIDAVLDRDPAAALRQGPVVTAPAEPREALRRAA